MITLQGIRAEATERKLAWYRAALSEKLGADFSAERVNLMASLNPMHHKGALSLGDYLQAQGGSANLDELFRDIVTLDEASNRLDLIRTLLEQVDNEEDFEGKREARAALADLSLEAKKLIRLNTV